MQDPIRSAARRLAKCRQVIVLTGAGISKESGIPTFREAQEGLWAQYDPMEMATQEGFLFLEGPGGRILPALLAALRGEQQS